MNLSGNAIRYWMEKEKIPKENLLVITDDINLQLGSIRQKIKGSDGGHDLVRSFIFAGTHATMNQFNGT